MWKIINITDTRLHDDHGVIIPGTGVQRPCDHCGKTHDIICDVTDGKITKSVGSTCAKKLACNWKKVTSITYETIKEIEVAAEQVLPLRQKFSYEAAVAANQVEIVDGREKLSSAWMNQMSKETNDFCQCGAGYRFCFERITKSTLTVSELVAEYLS